MSRIVIRQATPADAAGILALVRELAAYELQPDAVEADEASIAAALSGAEPVARALVAVDPADPQATPTGAGTGTDDPAPIVGMALWFRTFSTWTGRPGMWLEDLYVRPDHRRGGLGRQLLQLLAAHCVEHGWPRLEWTVLDWNTPAHAFYRSLGATENADWTTNRVSGEALLRLATPPA